MTLLFIYIYFFFFPSSPFSFLGTEKHSREADRSGVVDEVKRSLGMGGRPHGMSGKIMVLCGNNTLGFGGRSHPLFGVALRFGFM